MNRLTKEQKEFIIKNYETMKNKEIAETLNITIKQIYNYVGNNKLHKNYKSSISFNNIIETILSERKDNYDVNNYINNSIEPKIDNSLLYKSKYGKYYVNQNYFENIDNEWKAYWLGFLYADGSVNIKRNSIKDKMDYNMDLMLKDKEHLVKFLNSIQSDTIIKEINIKLNNNIYKNYRITICNKKICNDLNNLGCVPNKTFILTFPNNLREDLIRHFIRGYFDGDGCIHINLENKTITFEMLGTLDMLKGVEKYFKDNIKDINCKIFKPQNKNIYELRCYGTYNIGQLYKLLYKDCNIYLERKLKKFDILYCLD